MGLDKFYKVAKETNSIEPEKDDLILNAHRTITLNESIKNFRNEQNLRYEVREVNGVHILEVYKDNKHRGRFYLGSEKNKVGIQSVLSYVMFNATYTKEPENVLSYKWRAHGSVNAELIGTLFTDRIRQIMGPENYKPSYMRYPCILAIIAYYKNKPFARELKFSTIEEMQNIAQALRCFSFLDLGSFLNYIKAKDDEPFENFYEQSWIENSGASEQLTHSRDYYHATLLLKPKETMIDTVNEDEEGNST